MKPVKVGIVGVWTDVKVHYLAYDLVTRLGLERIAQLRHGVPDVRLLWDSDLRVIAQF